MEGLKPDLQIVFPGLQLLTDVVVANPLRLSAKRSTVRLAAARYAELTKGKKYNDLATRHHSVMAVAIHKGNAMAVLAWHASVTLRPSVAAWRE